jgi:hypothetical protein
MFPQCSKRWFRHYKLDNFPFKSTTTSYHEFFFITSDDFTKSLLVNISFDKAELDTEEWTNIEAHKQLWEISNLKNGHRNKTIASLVVVTTSLSPLPTSQPPNIWSATHRPRLIRSGLRAFAQGVTLDQTDGQTLSFSRFILLQLIRLPCRWRHCRRLSSANADATAPTPSSHASLRC